MNVNARLAQHSVNSRQRQPGPDTVTDEFDNGRPNDGPDAVVDEFDNSRNRYSDSYSGYDSYSGGSDYIGAMFLG